jgi:hypothetical protein
MTKRPKKISLLFFRTKAGAERACCSSFMMATSLR